MDISIFIAKALGLYLTIFSVTFMFRRRHFENTILKVIDTPPLHFIVGVVSLLVGVILVVSHNNWNNAGAIIVTLVAWIILIQGWFRIAFPNVPKKIAHWVFKRPPVITSFIFLVFILGLYLMAYGFLS